MSKNKQGGETDFAVPEWETTGRHSGHRGFKVTALEAFDRVLPKRRYHGLSRRSVCIIVVVGSLALLALILALAIGLSTNKAYA